MACRLILLLLIFIFNSHLVRADEFEPFMGKIKTFKKVLPKPGVASPAGSHSISYDPFGNFWLLREGCLMLLEAGENKWLKAEAPEVSLQFLEADENGIIWVASKTALYSLNPRLIQEGWLNHSKILQGYSISSVSHAPNGGIMLAAGKKLYLIARQHKSKNVSITNYSFDAEIRYCASSVNGDLYVESVNGRFLRKHSNNAWQKHWRLVSRLPCGNHDLSGDSIKGKYYFSGGLTDGYGFPAKPKAFEYTFEFNPLTGKINSFSLGYERVYCATSHLEGKVWIINGDVFSNGSRHSTSAVQILDRHTGKVIAGPPTFVSRPMPLAFNVNDRIYVIGNPKEYSEQPACVESIGPGEKHWRMESPGPSGMGPIAGTVLGDEIFIAVPKVGLAVFNVTDKSWYTVSLKMVPRSPQIAAYKGKIWLMGGRDVPKKMVQIYDPKSGEISRGPDLPRDLAWGTAAVLNKKLYLIGGAAGTCYSNSIFQLQD